MQKEHVYAYTTIRSRIDCSSGHMIKQTQAIAQLQSYSVHAGDLLQRKSLHHVSVTVWLLLSRLLHAGGALFHLVSSKLSLAYHLLAHFPKFLELG